MLKINTDPNKIKKTADKHKGLKRPASTCAKLSETKKAFIETLDGHNINTGHKQFYDPENPIQNHVQCLPESAPEGWVSGNWKAVTCIIGTAKRNTKFGTMTYDIRQKVTEDFCYCTMLSSLTRKMRLVEFQNKEKYIHALIEYGFEVNLYD